MSLAMWSRNTPLSGSICGVVADVDVVVGKVSVVVGGVVGAGVVGKVVADVGDVEVVVMLVVVTELIVATVVEDVSGCSVVVAVVCVVVVSAVGVGDKMKIYPGHLKIVNGLYFAGHRLMNPGGLPVAINTGRKAAQMVCRQFDVLFKSSS
jgi:hypothetical protein